MTYIVQADNPAYNDTFTSYQDAYAWLVLVRYTLGSNAYLITLRRDG